MMRVFHQMGCDLAAELKVHFGRSLAVSGNRRGGEHTDGGLAGLIAATRTRNNVQGDTIVSAMVPAGYIAKRVVTRPDWLGASSVSSIYSVCGCVSHDFTDYIGFWKHNGYWLFDSPDIITDIARENNIDLTETMLFFYEVYELQFNSGEWTSFESEPSFCTNVSLPEAKVLEGYDVVTFYVQTSPEHSPLSCNSLAAEVETNTRCLLQSFEQARTLLENGTFNDSEPGPYRIFAVYSLAWPGGA
jgi:hypothetical protein